MLGQEVSNAAAVLSLRGHERWLGSILEVQVCQLRQFQWHVLRLEDDCRHSRFGNAESDSFLWEYAARITRTNAIVIGCFVNRQMRGAAELRSFQS
jgi:RimJ/RimL family protein N-acetyltransferase